MEKYLESAIYGSLLFFIWSAKEYKICFLEQTVAKPNAYNLVLNRDLCV